MRREFLVSVGADIKASARRVWKLTASKDWPQTSPLYDIARPLRSGNIYDILLYRRRRSSRSKTRPQRLGKSHSDAKGNGRQNCLPKDTIKIWSQGRLKARISTISHPEFPTDLQQLMLSLMSVSEGVSTITETVFENRFQQAQELNHMGAKINIQGQYGGNERRGKELNPVKLAASDLRGGAALVGAALKAKGVSIISGDNYISRGYQT